MQQDYFIRWPQVKAITTLSRSSAWRMMKANQFPQSRKIGARARAWLHSEVVAWVEGRIMAGRQS